MEFYLKIFILALLSYAVSCDLIAVEGTSPDGYSMNKWKEIYNTSNHGSKEQSARRDLVNSLIRFINEHKKEYSKNKKPFQIDLNHHADMTPDEYKKQLHDEKTMGLNGEIKCNNSSGTYQPPTDVSLPSTVDYRKKGYVTPIRDQDRCGACWAFVVVAVLEGQYKRFSGKLVQLSEQNLIDCTKPLGNKGCNGGQMCRALEYATKIPGVATAKSYPFTNSEHPCRYNKSTPGVPVKGYLDIPEGDEHALKAAVALLGPVAAGFDGDLESFKHYKDGIYSDPSCKKDSKTHAVAIIGYGTENGTDYWLIKNSWGPSWGMNGFGKLLRNHNQCGIANSALFPVFHTNPDGTPKVSGPYVH